MSDLRVAGEGDLLARIDRLRKLLAAEGLLERQQRLPRLLLPRTIGVVTGEGGKARDDILAGLHRRGWAGRVVWGFAPVQDRHAALAITRALQDLAVVGGVDVAIVARGGGSLADLLCFCDETLCRTVALLGVPVIASVGHHTDRTLLDDVAAVSCSTPTHAAEEAVGVDCVRARAHLGDAAARLQDHGRRAVLGRARTLAALSRAPAEQVARQRRRLHQQLREIRAAGRRRVTGERALTHRRAEVLARQTDAAVGHCHRRGPRELERLALALAAHDPQRTLERGYALVQGPAGEPLPTAARARAQTEVRLRFADGTLGRRSKRTRARTGPPERASKRTQASSRERGAPHVRSSGVHPPAVRERDPHAGASLRDERGARGGDHPPPRHRRSLARRDAGAGTRGQGLIERCAGELEAVGGALEELRLEDLVARLESEGTPK